MTEKNVFMLELILIEHVISMEFEILLLDSIDFTCDYNYISAPFIRPCATSEQNVQ